MKLHLPIGLRIALLTVIASLSFAAGDVTITHDGQPVSQEEYPEGIIQKGTPMEGDIEITVSDDELIIEDDLAQKGDATITVDKDGRIVLRELGSIGSLSVNGDFKTEITVLEGGEFHQTGASAVGGGVPWNGAKHDKEITTETVVTVDGGLYEMKSTGMVYDENDGGYSYSRCTLGGSDIQYFNANIVDTTDIQVKNGGQFQMTAALEGRSPSFCLIGYAAEKGSQVVLNVTVEGEGSLFQLRSEAGNAHAYLAHAMAGTVKDATIHIIDKGKFELSQAGSAGETYINYAYSGGGQEAINHCEIKLENEGTMEVQGISNYDAAGIGIACALGESGDPSRVAIATAVTKLTVGKGSSFRMQSGAIGWAEAKNEGSIATSQTSILVQDGGSFTIDGTDLGTTYYSQYSGENGEMVAQTDITVEGPDSSFTLEGGATIGRVEKSSSKAGSFTAVNTTTILVKDGGLFKMNGGTLGYNKKETKDKINVETGTVAVELRGEGSVMRISDAKIDNRFRGKVTIDVYDQSCLEWNDSSVEASSSYYVEAPIITMHGGALKGGTQVPSNVKVKIDVDKSFSGDLDMGGLSASKILEGFKIDGAGAVIQNLSGTLTIKGTDNQIRVGDRSVKLSDGEYAGDAKALIGLNDGGKVSFSSGSKLTLLFGGDVIKDLADQKEKEEVSLEIWFTDGTVSFGTGKKAKDVFQVGAGWGLDVETVDITAEGGKITLSGSTKDVWFSSEADKGGHSEENLSAVSDKSKIVIDESATLNADQSGTLNLLEGTEDLAITGNAEVVLDHTGTPFHSSDTKFQGNINVTGGASLKKTGEGSLTVDGNLKTDGAVDVAAGELVLKGANNTVEGALSMAAEGTLQVAKDGQLTLSGDSNLTAGTLTGEGTITVAEESGSLTVGEGVTLGKDLSLKVEGTLTLHGERGTEEGEDAITGSGTLTVDKEGQLSTGSHLNMGISRVDVQGILSQGGGQIAANNIVVGKDGTYELKDGTINALPQGDAPGTLSLNVAGAFEMSGGEITDGAFTLNDGATLTQSDGTINGGSVTLNGSATMKQTGGKVTGGTFTLSDTATLTQSDAGTINGGSVTLNGSATMKQTGGEVTDGTFTLSDTATLTQSNGTIDGGSITLNGSATMMEQTGGQIIDGSITLGNSANLTQSNGTINGGSITLSDSATLTQTGGQITGGTLELNDSAALIQSDAGTIDGGSITLNSSANLTQSNGTINGASIKLNGSATMKQTGGEVTDGAFTLSDNATLTQSNGTIDGGSITLNGSANLTQSDGTIDGASITLSGSATMKQTGGEIIGGKLELSGGAKLTQSDAGTISGSSITLSGEDTGFTQAGGSIGEGATFSLKDGATLTLSGGSMNGAVTMEGEASLYDLGNQAAKGSITMHGGSLANAGNYAGTLAIQTDDTYTGALDLGGVDAAHITQVRIGASGTELRNLKSGSTLTFREGDQMVVGEQHVYREGQTEPAGGTMVQFQEGGGQIAFDGDSALRLHLKSEVLKDLEGQLEILFTNGSFSGMPEGGQKELEAWLGEHFVLDAGLEDIKVLLLNDAEGGHLILTGSSSGIWIASRNGQNVDVADLLNHYSAVIADKDLTLTLPTTQEEQPTIVNQLQNERETHGDFIVKTESGATAGHTVQLHNANTNGDNGGTDFYGNIRVEGTGLEAATLEKTGDAALNVHGNLESIGAVQVKEGTLALGGTANSVGTLAMSGGELQVDGTLALTGATEMSEGSSGSISGKGNVKLGSGASLTLAGGVSYEVQNTQLENGAQMSQKGEAAIKGGSITLGGEGTGYTQAGGTIDGATFTLTEGTSFTQAGGSIGKGAEFSLGDGAKLTLSGGSMNGAVTMEGKTSSYDLGNQTAQGSIAMHGGSLANAGSYAGSLAIQTSDTYTGALDLGGVDAARITSIQLAGKDTYLTGLKEGSTLTLHAGDSFKVTEQNVWESGEEALEGKQAIMQFGTNAGDAGDQSIVDVADGVQIKLDLDGKLVAAQRGHITLEVWLTNGRLTGENSETWAKEHFTLGTGWGLSVESWNAEKGKLILSGKSNVWDAVVDGTEDAVGHVSVDAETLSQFDKVVIDERTTVKAEGSDGVVRQLEGSTDLEIQGSGIVAFENKHEESAFVPTGDTTLHGNIVAGDEVGLRKTGDASLTVDGDLKAGGDVAVEEGKLVLGENGEHSIGGELSLGEHGTLQVDGKLTLSQSQDLTGSQGSITGSGTVVLDGDFTVGDVGLGKDLTFQMGKAKSANFGDKAVTFRDLEGDKTITITAGGVTLAGKGTFSGTINGDTTVQGEYALSGATIKGMLDNGGAGGTGSTLKIASGDSSAGAQITVNGRIVFRKGAETDFTINLSDPGLWTANEEEHDATMLSTGETIYIEKGTKFVIDCSQKGISDAKGDLTHVVILRGGSIQEVDKYNAPEKNSGANRQAIYAASARAAYAMQTRAAEEQPEEQQVQGAQVEGGVLFNQLYETPTMWTNGTASWINAKHRTMSPLANLATTSNSMSGLRLLWQDLNDKGLTQATQQVSEILALLDNLAATNSAAARQMMAAVAGSTLTSLSSAQNAALRNQMSRVRDHALQAARLRGGEHPENGQENVVTDPKGVTVRTAQQTLSSGSTTHAWIEGTSFFSEQHSVGDESGYRLNSWGGAVGVDKQLADNWSVGAYLSASYGDLEARAAEYAKGDMDTYAVGVWGQNHTGRWGNTLLALWAWNDASLRRMVNHGAGYAGRSDADGYSIGAQWELTYDLYMNEEKTNVLQPLFGVAVMRTEMDGFSEKGAGSLGLNVKDQARDTVTLALGARWLATIGSGKAINRTVNTELHANVAQDLGDRRSDADVALQANPTYIRNVRGAKAGSTALQFGAGVNVPMTPNSQIYVNAGGELREHASSWNAALGVRMGF